MNSKPVHFLILVLCLLNENGYTVNEKSLKEEVRLLKQLALDNNLIGRFSFARYQGRDKVPPSWTFDVTARLNRFWSLEPNLSLMRDFRLWNPRTLLMCTIQFGVQMVKHVLL